MDLIPFYGEQPLTASNVTVRARASDRQHAKELVARTSKEIKIVNDEDSYTAARRAAGLLKGLSKEIYQSKRAAKSHFETVLATIEDLAKELTAPVDAEEARIIGLMRGHVQELERKQRVALKALQEKQAAEELAHQQKIKEMDAEAAKVAQLERDLELETRAMTMEPPKGVVPGGRVTHPWKFKLLNAKETVLEGGLRLLRIELDNLACNDAVRAQLEIAPDKMPTLPGIEVTQDTSIIIKPISRIQ